MCAECVCTRATEEIKVEGLVEFNWNRQISWQDGLWADFMEVKYCLSGAGRSRQEGGWLRNLEQARVDKEW